MLAEMMKEFIQKYTSDKNVLEKLEMFNDLNNFFADMGAVISTFNTKSKRMVKVISGDDVFEGEVTAIRWDIDQWTYMVDGEWFCQSEINCVLREKKE